MKTPPRIALVLALASTLLLGACAPSSSESSGSSTSPRDVAWAGEVPSEGFWLSVTSHLQTSDSTLSAHASTRFVIEADGQLRAAQGSLADEDFFPPPVRRLSREQLAMIWSELVALDVVKPRSRTHADEIQSAIQQHVSFTRFVASANAHQRSGIVLSTDIKAPEAGKLVNQLSTWAWMAAPSSQPGVAK